MKTTIIALAVLLAVQVGVAVGVNLHSSGLAGEQAKVALLKFKPGDVNRIAISDDQGQTVTVARKGDGWVLPDHKDFPADTSKIKGVLDDLTAAQEGAPVATSPGADKRFKVADKTFQRKVVFGPADKPLATVYFGSSQGTNQVDVRRADQKGVRRIEFGIYRLEASADNWADNTALKMDTSKITGLSWGKVKLERKAADTSTSAAAKADKTPVKTDGKTPVVPPPWMLAGDPPQPVKTADTGKILDALGSLRITGLADGGPGAKDTPVVDLTVSFDGGKSKTLKLWAQKDNSFILESSDQVEPVKLSKSTGSGLVAALANPDFQPKPPASPAPAAQQSGSAAPDTTKPDAAAPAQAAAAPPPPPTPAAPPPAASTGG